MSLKIPYPFVQHIKHLHQAGFKFMPLEGAWVNYQGDQAQIESKLPLEIHPWIRPFFTLHDSINRLKTKGNIIVAEDPNFRSWQEQTLEDSLHHAYQAEQENQARERILLKIKADFSRPQVQFAQSGYGVSQEGSVVMVKAPLISYQIKSLGSVLRELAYFISLPEDQVRHRDFTSTPYFQNEGYLATLTALKVLALTEVLCAHYDVPPLDRNMILGLISEYPDSEKFFKSHIHLVPVFSNYSLEDKQNDELTFKWLIEKDKMSVEDSRRQVNLTKAEILQRRHKIQVLSSFLDKKLTKNYTMKHVWFLFNKQVENLG